MSGAAASAAAAASTADDDSGNSSASTASLAPEPDACDMTRQYLTNRVTRMSRMFLSTQQSVAPADRQYALHDALNAPAPGPGSGFGAPYGSSTAITLHGGATSRRNGAGAAARAARGGGAGGVGGFLSGLFDEDHSYGSSGGDSCSNGHDGEYVILVDSVEQASKAAAAHGSRHAHHHRSSVLQTVFSLLTLQLGWGLWLLPCDFARLGWWAGFGTLAALGAATAYSGSLFTRLFGAVPNAVLLGDVGEAAAGRLGRTLVYVTIYSLDATRCIILHLAATQSIFYAVSPMMPGGTHLPLWQASVAVAVVVLALAQVRYLAQLSRFFMAGTVAQMAAIFLVVHDLVSNPQASLTAAEQEQELLRRGEYDADGTGWRRLAASPPDPLGGLAAWMPIALAVSNMVFAFGGQFAFLEIITSMRSPGRFTRAVLVCTAVMALVYGGLGGVGYWSKGTSIHGIVVFNMREGRLAQLAAGLVFIQAIAQYLVNLNVWTHNLLVLLSRRLRAAAPDKAADWDEDEHAVATGDHNRTHWLACTAFVVAYASVIAVAIPFFTTLVGFVTSVTYLNCAYTLPAWFALRLLGSRLSGLERAWLLALIPASLLLSVLGLIASIHSYMLEGGGGEGF